MVLILDGNSENDAHVWRKKRSNCEKLFLFVAMLSTETNAFNKSNNRDHSTRAHLFLSYDQI